MPSWLHSTPDPSAKNLTERLARSRDLAGSRHVGDEFGQGGWEHHASEPPPLPSAWLTLIPYLVLIIVAVALTLGLIVIAGGQS